MRWLLAIWVLLSICACNNSSVDENDDQAAPETNIVSGPQQFEAVDTATITFDSSEAATFQCQLDDSEWQECTSPFEAEGLREGKHVFQVRAIDKAGNEDSTPAEIQWTVDLTKPTTKFVETLGAFTNKTSAKITFRASEKVSTIKCQLDDGASEDCSGGNFTITQAGEGEHHLSVQSTDLAGNEEEVPAVTSWVFDTTLPQATIVGGPSATTSDAAPAFSFACSEATCTYVCSLDSGDFGACMSGQAVPVSMAGSHSFAVKAVDQAGNLQSNSATWNWETLEWRVASGGSGHTCAARYDGALFCWGVGNIGEQGQGNESSNLRPQLLAGYPNVATVSARYQHSCAIDDFGSLFCWGRNSWGQLGLGTKTGPDLCNSGTIACSTSPELVGSSQWSAVTAGGLSSCAISNDGGLYCWGLNDEGQLGTGSVTESLSPALVSAPTWKQIASGSRHACAIKTDSTLWCWGKNSLGQLGLGTFVGPATCGGTACSKSPLQVTQSTGWVAIALGADFSCALKGDGALWCTGDNSDGQLGIGNTTFKKYLTQLPSAGMWTKVAVGDSHACALQSDGSLWCWGDNFSGQLGQGSAIGPDTCTSTACSKSPVRVGIDTDWVDIFSGNDHSCAIKQDTSLWCWGDSSGAQGGNGAGGTTLYYPTRVLEPN